MTTYSPVRLVVPNTEDLISRPFESVLVGGSTLRQPDRKCPGFFDPQIKMGNLWSG